jgi:hypothetical protein
VGRRSRAPGHPGSSRSSRIPERDGSFRKAGAGKRTRSDGILT